MTRRERLENKLEKRAEWADKAKARSASASKRAYSIMDGIPLGQPILVGHHSERHARRDAERIDNAIRAANDNRELASHHAEKAAGLADQLDRTIFSDDNDAHGCLEERIATREADAARMVAVNKAWRQSKGDVAKFAALAGIPEARAQVFADGIAKAYSWEKQPYPTYTLSNLRSRIRADKERMAIIAAQQKRAAQAEANGGVVIEGTEGSKYVRVTFAEKPERSIIDALKSAGFTWHGGSWQGERANLPQLPTGQL
jgi:hypothetical protein